MSTNECLFYLLFLKRSVKQRKHRASRMPQESSVHTTALNTGERERLGSSTDICVQTHTHKHRGTVFNPILPYQLLQKARQTARFYILFQL